MDVLLSNKIHIYRSNVMHSALIYYTKLPSVESDFVLFHKAEKVLASMEPEVVKIYRDNYNEDYRYLCELAYNYKENNLLSHPRILYSLDKFPTFEDVEEGNNKSTEYFNYLGRLVKGFMRTDISNLKQEVLLYEHQFKKKADKAKSRIDSTKLNMVDKGSYIFLRALLSILSKSNEVVYKLQVRKVIVKYKSLSFIINVPDVDYVDEYLKLVSYTYNCKKLLHVWDRIKLRSNAKL